MPRPRIKKKVCFNPKVCYFKPQGIPVKNLEIIELNLEETEALRLKNIENLEQTECGKKMNISQSTFQRTLKSAYQKISKAIIEGKAIRIEEK
jgi:predicted DNA-binding protein (UPF0251 family)